MKKILLILSIFFVFSLNIGLASAAENALSDGGMAPVIGSTNNTSSSQKVFVTEIVPGVKNCKCVAGGANGTDALCPASVPVYQRKYECDVDKGLTAFQALFASVIRWFLYVAMLICVMALIGLGIAWSFAGADDAKSKSSLKKWGINLLVGLIILFMFQPILKFLAPWIYQ